MCFKKCLIILAVIGVLLGFSLSASACGLATDSSSGGSCECLGICSGALTVSYSYSCSGSCDCDLSCANVGGGNNIAQRVYPCFESICEFPSDCSFGRPITYYGDSTSCSCI